jgi:hypothetical protein
VTVPNIPVEEPQQPENALGELAAYQPVPEPYPGVDPLIAQLSPGMAQILAALPQPLSITTEGTDTAEGFGADGAIETELVPNDVVNEEDAEVSYDPKDIAAQAGLDLEDPDTRYAIAELYGDDCPLLFPDPTEEQWCAWGPSLWGRHEASMQPILHRAEKLRNFRDGNQWISSRGYGMWYVPPKPSGMVRVVDNMMAPAMDYRVEIVAEQRPGFKTKPENQDQRTLKRAEAQQAGVEYQFDQQKIPKIQREAEYWAQIRRCRVPRILLGPRPRTVGRGSDRASRAAGAAAASASWRRNTVVHRIDEVRVAANATSTIKPNYMVIRKTRPLAKAIAEYGKGGRDRNPVARCQRDADAPDEPSHKSRDAARPAPRNAGESRRIHDLPR